MRQRVIRSLLITLLAAAGLASAGCGAPETDVQEAPMGIIVTSTAFTAGQPIPVRYTGQGGDISPDLSWKDTVQGIVSFALICDDPDAPRGTWVHWIMWNIPATAKGLVEGIPATASLPDGSVQGLTTDGTPGYHGPTPPPGNAHHYYFRIYALDVMLRLPASADRAQLDTAMKGHVLSQGQLMGTYQRH